MQLTQHLAQALAQALQNAQQKGDLPSFQLPEITIERPKETTHGDLSTPVALRVTKLAKMPPRKVAELIIASLPPLDYVAEVGIAGAGFLNFRLTQGYLQAEVERILANPAEYGAIALGRGRKVQIECVSANPTGPITIGRLRGGVIGDTLARLMRAAGWNVTLEYYYNDAGRQIQLLGESVQIRYLQTVGETATLTDEHYQGEYITDIATDLTKQFGETLKDRPSSWFGNYAKEVIRQWQMRSLASVQIIHDIYFNEAELYEDGRLEETLAQLAANGYLYEKDGAKWLRTTAFGDDADRVAIRSTDGLPTYRVPDIAYHKNKVERGFDLVVDIFGPDHHAVAPQVLMGVQMLGLDTSFVHTLLHQIVTLVRDGKEVRMSTRKGRFVTLDELVDEVGPDPVRYFMLARSATSHVEFDLDLAVERSDKNPVYYIQNAHVRCAGIGRKWIEAGRTFDEIESADLSLLTHPLELAFLKKAIELSDLIALAATSYEPHHIAFYATDLAGTFHPLYDECRVLADGVSPELQRARLKLYFAAQAVFARVLGLMGMSAPDRM